MMKKVDIYTYANFIGVGGFIRTVEYELKDRVSIVYKNHVGTVMAKSIYYANGQEAEYVIREITDGG